MCADPESTKNSQVVSFFVLSVSADAKAACRTLMKLNPGELTFTNQRQFVKLIFSLL